MNRAIYDEELRAACAGHAGAFAGKRFLITGATGLIGSFLVDALLSTDADVRVYAAGRSESGMRARFGDAMDDSAEMGLDALQDSVMSLSGIKQPKYYDKVFKLAVDQRVVQTTMDRYGRVVVIPVTS